MQKQDNDKSVVHNKPEYANVQMLWWKFYWLYTRVLIIFTKQSWELKTNKSESISQSIPERREPDRMSAFRERKPTSKGLLARVKCQRQRNARMSAILSVFPKPRESVSSKKSCYVAGSITSLRWLVRAIKSTSFFFYFDSYMIDTYNLFFFFTSTVIWSTLISVDRHL